jgi:L-asparaginase
LITGIPKVFVLRLVPGMNPDIFSFLKEHYDGLVIESFGVGGIPCYDNEDFIDAVADWIACGKALVMTTQVPHEGSDMSVYMVGQVIKKKYRLMEAYDMTTEAIVTKLMWILAQTKNPDEVRELFYRPVQNDLNI